MVGKRTRHPSQHVSSNRPTKLREACYAKATSSEESADLRRLVSLDKVHGIAALPFQLNQPLICCCFCLAGAVRLCCQLALQTSHLLLVGLNTQEQ